MASNYTVEQAAQISSLKVKMSAAKGASEDDLCSIYHESKPTLDAVLEFVKDIPEVGQPIFDAAKLLERLADLACAS